MLGTLPGDQAGVSGGLGEHGFAGQKAAQVVGHLARRGVAVRRILFPAPSGKYSAGPWGWRDRCGAGAPDLPRECVRNRSARLAGMEGRGAGEQFVEHRRRARTHRCARPDLAAPAPAPGKDIRACQRFRRLARAASALPGRAPVRNRGALAPGPDPPECSPASDRGADSLRWRNSTASDHLAASVRRFCGNVSASGGARKMRAFQVLHDEVRRLVGRPQTVDADDVRMADSRAMARASAMKRARSMASSGVSRRQRLVATLRPSASSIASSTRPMPPEPISATILWPEIAPGAPRGIDARGRSPPALAIPPPVPGWRSRFRRPAYRQRVAASRVSFGVGHHPPRLAENSRNRLTARNTSSDTASRDFAHPLRHLRRRKSLNLRHQNRLPVILGQGG